MSDMKPQDTSPNIEESPGQFVSYSNYCQVTVTPEEIAFQFARNPERSDGHAEGVAKIYMSLPAAKRLVEAMRQLITTYEESFGEIPADPSSRLTEIGRQRLGLAEKE